MREILFRGKRIDNGEWVEGYVDTAFTIDENRKVKSRHFTALDCLGCSSQVIVLDETVGQYTGLTDKNGVKIFEGDIIRFKDNIGYVIYTDDDASFLVDSPNRYIAMDYSSEFEIIGNIYDNPELMKGGEK